MRLKGVLHPNSSPLIPAERVSSQTNRPGAAAASASPSLALTTETAASSSSRRGFSGSMCSAPAMSGVSAPDILATGWFASSISSEDSRECIGLSI